jgi:nucleoside-diphosphate-sugar epimerase
MKRILVTGANGFVGKKLIRQLNLSGNYQVFSHDIDVGDISRDKFKYSNINHVFHLAAKTFVPDSWENPYAFYQTNIMGTVNILEFCRKNNIDVTVMSSYVYGVPEKLPVTENDLIKSYNPYGHTKAIAEDICSFYNEKFKVNITIFRPFNIYGPAQSDKFLIPHIIKQFLDPNNKFIEVKDLKPKRDYVYIDDVIQALLKSINKKGFSIYNLGSGSSYSVEEIILYVKELSQINKTYVSLNSERQNEVMDLVADISKIENELGWSPEVTIKDGLKRTIEKSITSKKN